MYQQESANAADTAGVVAPPPLIALATLLFGFIFDWLLPLYVLNVVFGWTTRLVIGGILIAAGALIAVIAERTFRRIGTNVPPWKPALKLATDGIYRWIRNPMYLGLGLIVVGAGITFASDWTLVLFIPAAMILHYGVVRREERYLDRKFGEEYRRYRRSVPRYGWPV